MIYAVEIVCSLAGLGATWWLMRWPHRATPIRVPRLAANGILPTISDHPSDYVGYV